MALPRPFPFFLAACLTAEAVVAADPAQTYLYPIAGQQGTTAAVMASGKFEPWPPQVWVDAPGIAFTAGDKPGKFNVEIAKDAAPGPHLVRFITNSGASAPRFFIVSREPETADAEPNDEYASPQKLASLPATVNGRLDKAGDVDSFAVELKHGQTLVAWLDAYVLGSAFDGMLRIVDSRGAELAFNHDARTMDPFLAWEAPQDGTYVVQVMGWVYPASSGVQFTGGEGCVYRLHLTNQPFVRCTVPMSAPRGTKTPVELIGWNLPSKSAEVDGTPSPDNSSFAALPDGLAAGFPPSLADAPESLEREPNNSPAEAQPLNLPCAATGRIEPAKDEDRFSFMATKGRAYEVRLTAARVGSPLDAWLKIENKDGKELARSDDDGASKDPQLAWTAPADGVFIAAVGDVTHRGGADFIYRIAIEEAAPRVEAVATAHALKVDAGKSGEWKVTVKRINGFTAKLQLAALDLPDGVSAPEADVPEKGGDVTLKLNASPEAQAANKPIRLVLRETETGKEHPVTYLLISTSEDNGVPQGYSELVIPTTEQLWLTVAAAAAPVAAADPK